MPIIENDMDPNIHREAVALLLGVKPEEICNYAIVYVLHDADDSGSRKHDVRVMSTRYSVLETKRILLGGLMTVTVA